MFNVLTDEENARRLKRLKSATGVAYPVGYFIFREIVTIISWFFMKPILYYNSRIPQPGGVYYRPDWYRRNGLGPVGKYPGYVIAVNHGSILDIPFVGMFKRGLVWICKPSFCLNPFLAQINQRMGAVPVFRPSMDGNTDRVPPKRAKRLQMASYTSSEAINIAVQAIGRGVPVEMFPEGTRVGSSRVDDSKLGAARIARLSGCPLLPIATIGLSKNDPVHRTRILRRRIVIGLVGCPIYPSKYLELGDDRAIEMAMMQEWESSINSLRVEGMAYFAL